MIARREQLLKILLPVLLIAGLLLLWHFVVQRELINTALFPGPVHIASTIGTIEGLGTHVASSLARLCVSVCIGYVLGFIVGFIVGFYREAAFLEDLVAFFMAIPGISWAPLFIILIGFGEKTIFLVGVLTAFFPVMYNIYHGFKEIDKNLVHLGDLFEYTPLQQIVHIKLPSIMNYMVTALKLSIARTWRTIIAVEMVAGTMHGLGYMVFDARELINTPVMFAGIFLSGILYFVIEKVVIHVLERATVVRWGMKTAS